MVEVPKNKYRGLQAGLKKLERELSLSPKAILTIVFLASMSAFLTVGLLSSLLYRKFSLETYLVFHNFAEVFSIIVSFSISGVGWHAYKHSKNTHSLFLSCAFLAVGLIDLMHTLSFPGMPSFITPSSTNKGIQFWLSARLLSAAGLLVSAYVYSETRNRFLSQTSLMTLAFGISAAVFAVAIYFPSYLPPMFIEGVGLTAYKIYAEYVIIGLFTAAFFAYWQRLSKTGNTVHVLFLGAFIVSIFSELAFTLYKSAFDTYNMLGHIYKIIAFYLIYRGVFIESIQHPYVKLTETGEELFRANQAHMVLSRCNQTLVRATDEMKLLHEICRGIVETGRYRLAWVGFSDHDEEKTVRPAAQAGYEEGYLETVNITWADNERGRDPTGTAIRTGKPSVIKNILADPNYTPWRAEAIKRGYASAIALPLISNGKPFGALNIYAKEQDAFDEEEIALLTELADDLAYGIISLRTAAERKHAEEALRQSEEKYRALMINASDAIMLIDKGGHILEANKEAGEILGYPKEEVFNAHFTRFIPEEELERTVAAFKETARKGSGSLLDGGLLRKDGKTVPVDVTASVIEYTGKQGIQVIFRDVTERKIAEEMRLENIRLEAADKAKSEFLASMSHELRTPLNAIIGFSELLKQNIAGELNEKQKRYAEDILTSGNHLLALINDILDLSKVEAGKIELVVEKLSVPQAINEGLTLVKEKAMRHNIKLKTELDAELEFIEADRLRFKQILFNLLSNAVKFSKLEGGIVTVKTKKEGDTARISVSDTGIGIKEEDMGKLFKEFEQISSGISRRYGGTGLGLVISKKLAELHGGKISAESRYGEGSTFTFLLPLKAKREAIG